MLSVRKYVCTNLHSVSSHYKHDPKYVPSKDLDPLLHWTNVFFHLHIL